MEYESSSINASLDHYFKDLLVGTLIFPHLILKYYCKYFTDDLTLHVLGTV